MDEQQKKDLLTGGAKALQQGAGQMEASLAAQGMRGGQAATHMRRYLGETSQNTQMDINKLAYEEAAKRASEKRAYEAAKASRGQSAQLMPGTF